MQSRSQVLHQNQCRVVSEIKKKKKISELTFHNSIATDLIASF